VYQKEVKRLLSSNGMPAQLNEAFADEIIAFFLAHDQNVAVPVPNVVLKDKLANALMLHFEKLSHSDRKAIPDQVPLSSSSKSNKKRRAVALQHAPNKKTKQENLSKHLMQQQEETKQSARNCPSPLQLEPALPSYHTEAEKDAFDLGWYAHELLHLDNFFNYDQLPSEEDGQEYSQASLAKCIEEMINSSE
jgi:hypothetical protein